MTLLKLQVAKEAQKKAEEKQKKAEKIQSEATKRLNLEWDHRILFGEDLPRSAINHEAYEESNKVEASSMQREVPTLILADLLERRRLVAGQLIACHDNCTQKELLYSWRQYNVYIKQLLAI